ncbi:MAG TPA: hypothetical protein VGG28_23800 [Kofleriaceae bacterium]
MSAEHVAAIASITDRSDRYRAISRLRPPFDDDVIAYLTEALEDHVVILVGEPGWEEDHSTIGSAARHALILGGQRVERFVAPKLASSDRELVDHAVAILARCPALEQTTIDALLRHATESALARDVGAALRGKLDARPLLDFPETRLVGFLATPELEPAWLRQLLDDPDPTLHWHVLDRIRGLEPPPHELAPALVARLQAGDGFNAIAAIAKLRPDDEAITAAMLDALASEGVDDHAAALLAHRPAAHLRAHLAWLLEQLQRGRTEFARALAGLGSSAPPEVALALGRELAAGRAYLPIVDALRALGVAALPALPAVVAAAQDRDDEYRAESCSALLEKLHALGRETAIAPRRS